ncbi:MAG: hypothetical protein IKX60_07055 [Bacteroidales bacterium]|nr:hypothetical protein [Bacteroidales bacterium]
MNKQRIVFTLLFLLYISTSCENDIIDIVFPDEEKNSFSCNLFTTEFITHQSAASYGDYCVFITNRRSSLYLYNLKTKSLLCEETLRPAKGLDYWGYDLYHCNQATFGEDFYSEQDVFPLLYVSQRANEDRRCFIEVFRIQPSKEGKDVDYSSLSATLVQTIYLPKMNSDNCLGNVNCVIEKGSQKMYTYSRNNNNDEANYGYCKISCFDIPDVDIREVVLNDSDIKDSFMLDCSAVNMQGGCINKGYLYIGQGYQNAGYIFLNVINLKEKKIDNRIDLLAMGIQWEPEGCFIYNDTVMLSTASGIIGFKF